MSHNRITFLNENIVEYRYLLIFLLFNMFMFLGYVYAYFDFLPIFRKIFFVLVTIINKNIYMVHTFSLEWKISSGFFKGLLLGTTL